MKHRIPILVVLSAAVVLLMLATWHSVLTAEAVFFDDQQYLFENHRVQHPSWRHARQFLIEVLEPATVGGYYQPLTMISLMLDTASGGGPENLKAYHRTSLALHVANTVLVIVLLYMLFRRPLFAALIGLMFGVHPLTVESVAWIADRKTVLATFFALVSLALYVVYARSDFPAEEGNRASSRLRPALFYGTGLLAFVLSLMSKPTTVTLPLVLLLLDFWPLRRVNRRCLLDKIPWFVISLLSVWITFVSQARTASVQTPEAFPAWYIPLKLCHNVVHYLATCLWPVHLSSYYPMPKPFDLSNPSLLAGLIGMIVLVTVSAVSLRWTRVLLTGILIFFVLLLPALGIVSFSNEIAADKYAYFPILGLLLILGYGADRGCMLRAGTVLLAILFLGLSFFEIRATRAALRRWQTTETLIEHMIRLAPDAAPLQNDCGAALLRNSRFDEAIPYFIRALQADPRFHVAHYNLAVALTRQNRIPEAIRQYELAVQIKPDYVDALNNLGLALLQSGYADRAIACYRKAIASRRESYAAHFNLADALAATNRGAEAVEQYREALKINPDLAEAYCNMAAELIKLGRFSEAVEAAKHALVLRSDYANAHYNLAVGLQNLKNTAEAVAHLNDAIRLMPDFAEARNNLGAILFSQGHVDQAMQQFQELVRLKPDWIDARYNLGYILESQGKLPEAAEQYRHILRVDPQNADAQLRLEAIRGRLPQTQAVGPKP